MKLKKLLLFGIVIIAITNISRGQASYGTQIGCTYYDLQTNSSVRNGLVRNPDGTMAAVWIQSHSDVFQPVGTDRGIGYNYYDGTQWVYLNILPATPCPQGECGIPHGCASDYIGWPSILHNDSGEVVIAHFFGAVTGPSITKRPNAGSGPWSATVLLPLSNPIGGDGLAWPRAVADSNYVHLIYTSPNGSWNGVFSPFVYFRSSDYGTTWDIDSLMLPGMDTTIISGMGGDAYALDARGGTVAILAGGWGDPWVLWKSSMNGDTGTWTYQIIAPFGDTTGVTQWLGDSTGAMWACDDAHAIAVDNNGLVHASAGQIVVNVDSITGQTTGSWFPFADNGLYYWNENMNGNWNDTMTLPLIVGGLVDLPDFNTGAPADGDPSSGIGNNTFHFFQGVIASPQISIDQNNNPYIVYSALVEWTTTTGDTSGSSFRDLYLVYSPDGGNTWNKPVNIAGEIGGVIDGSSGTAFEDETYPMTHRMIWADDSLNIVWQVDGVPGTLFKDGVSTPPVDTDLQSIIHFSFNVSTQLPAFERGVPNAVVIVDTSTSTCSIEVGSLGNALGVLGMHFGQLWYSINGGAYQSSPVFDNLSAGIYSIVVKDATNDSIIISVEVSCGTGINQLTEGSSIKLYPNPTNGTLNIDLVNVKATNIMVYNLLGKAVAKVNGVKSQLNANYTIDLSTLANGTYIVKIQSVDKVITRRVFLNR